MAIDQSLLIPTLCTCSGSDSITVAQLFSLLAGGNLPMIDQSLLIPTYRTNVGLPAETIADLIAEAGGAAAGLTNLLGLRFATAIGAAASPATSQLAIVPSFAERTFAFFVFARDRSGVAGLPDVTSIDLTINGGLPQNFDTTFRAAVFTAASGFQELGVWIVEDTDLTDPLEEFNNLLFEVNYTGAAANNSVGVFAIQINRNVMSTVLAINAGLADPTLVWPAATTQAGGIFLAVVATAGSTAPNDITNFDEITFRLSGVYDVNTQMDMFGHQGATPFVEGLTTLDANRFIMHLIVNPA